METNYYTSIHTNISYERTVKTSGRQIEEKNKIDMALERANKQKRALAILMGASSGKPVNRVDTYTPQVESPYITYGNVNQVIVTTKAEIEYLDNSGPCTANMEVDSVINVDDYIQAAKQKNHETIRNSGYELTFHTLENYEDVGDAYFKALEEKYTILHREAMQHADPARYLKDKYTNPESPFYESELTWYERDIAYRYEKQMLKEGKIHGVHFQDSLFRDKIVNGLQSNGDERRYNRKVMNQQLSNILQNYGISVPEDVNLRCTVDPVTCHISIEDVTGAETDRGVLCSQIENVLNVKENGLNLYQHIIQSSYSAVEVGSTQYHYDGRIKFQYCHNTDGISKGMDGDYNQKFIEYCEKYYPSYAEKARELGFDGFPDMYLSINLTSNGFEDVFQDVNWCNDADETIVEWQGKSAYTTL